MQDRFENAISPHELSWLEQQVLEALACGQSVERIAKDLGLAIADARRIIRDLYRRAALHSARKSLRAILGAEGAIVASERLSAVQELIAARGGRDRLAALIVAIQKWTGVRLCYVWQPAKTHDPAHLQACAGSGPGLGEPALGQRLSEAGLQPDAVFVPATIDGQNWMIALSGWPQGGMSESVQAVVAALTEIAGDQEFRLSRRDADPSAALGSYRPA